MDFNALGFDKTLKANIQEGGMKWSAVFFNAAQIGPNIWLRIGAAREPESKGTLHVVYITPDVDEPDQEVFFGSFATELQLANMVASFDPESTPPFSLN